MYKQFGIRDVYFGLGKLGMICRKKGGMKLKGKAAQVKGVTELAEVPQPCTPAAQENCPDAQGQLLDGEDDG